MKIIRITLSVVFLLGTFCTAQSSRPVPAGMRHAHELEMQNENLAPSAIPERGINPAAMQSEAQQLAELAASVPPGIQKANRGLLQKDLIQRLKQIEKLSKHLRSQLDH